MSSAFHARIVSAITVCHWPAFSDNAVSMADKLVEECPTLAKLLVVMALKKDEPKKSGSAYGKEIMLGPVLR
jgi:hypothetical protein